MGAKQSLELNISNFTDISDSVTNNIKTTIDQVATNSCTTTTSLNVLVGLYEDESKKGIGKCKTTAENLNINQTVNNVCNLINNITVDDQAKLINNFQTKMAQGIQAAQTAQAGFLSALNASQKIKGNYVNSISVSNMINNNMDTTFNTVCNQAVTSSQAGNITVCGNYKNINIDQDTNSVGFNSCTGNYITNILSSNSILNDINQNITAQQKEVSEGIDDLFKWVTIVIGGIILLVILAGIIMMIVSKPPSR